MLEVNGLEPRSGLTLWDLILAPTNILLQPVCNFTKVVRAPDKAHIFNSKMTISSPNPMFDHLLESSHQDDSNKWSNIGFGEEITRVESIEFILRTLSGAMSSTISVSGLTPVIESLNGHSSKCVMKITLAVGTGPILDSKADIILFS